jgi:hypothetical protein
MSFVNKCLEIFFLGQTFLQIAWENWEIIAERPHVFVRNKCTTFSSIRIIALRFVDKIFPESHDFAVNRK